MTNKKAIEELKYRLSIAKYIEENYVDCIRIETVELAIKALENDIIKCDACFYKDYFDDNGGVIGQWMYNYRNKSCMTCSVCGSIFSCQKIQHNAKYCQMCGARMLGDGNEVKQ